MNKRVFFISVILIVVILAVFFWGNSQANRTQQQAEKQKTEAISEMSLSATSQQEDPWADYKKPSAEELKKELSTLAYEVTQEAATEPAYENPYYDHYKNHQGIYVDAVSGEPLFSTLNQYPSGTGWPSFTKPLEPSNITTKVDYKLVYPRTEVLSKHAGSHLGHVFEDGPETAREAQGAAPTGLRYCLNSAAMKFIPADELGEKGYDQYSNLFE